MADMTKLCAKAVCELLLDNTDADASRVNNEEKSALFYAMERSGEMLVKHLLTHMK